VSALVADRADLINVVNPAAPSLEGSLYAAELDGSHGAAQIDNENVAHTAHLADTFNVINIADKASPILRSSITGTLLDGAVSCAVDKVNKLAYVSARYANKLVKVDISNLDAPTILADVTIDPAPSVVVLKDKYALVTHTDTASVVNDLTVVDVEAMTVIATYNFHDSLLGIMIDGNLAYACSLPADTFCVLDVTDVTAITELGTVTSTQLDGVGSKNLGKKDNYVFVVSYLGDSFVVIDVSDPSLPQQVAYITDPLFDGGLGVVSYGDYAYVASYAADAVVVVDVSDPLNPTIVGSLSIAELNGAHMLALIFEE